jgi:hypothetical protein
MVHTVRAGTSFPLVRRSARVHGWDWGGGRTPGDRSEDAAPPRPVSLRTSPSLSLCADNVGHVRLIAVASIWEFLCVARFPNT